MPEFLIHLIRFCCHDEIIAMQPSDFVRPLPIGCPRIVHVLSTHGTTTGLTTTVWRELCMAELEIKKSVFYKYRTQAIEEHNYVEEKKSRNVLTPKGKKALEE